MPDVECSRKECLSRRKDGRCGAGCVQWVHGKCDGYITASGGMRQETAANVERRHGALVNNHGRPLK